MRILTMAVMAGLLAVGADARGEWSLRTASKETNAWHVVRSSIGTATEGVAFRHEGKENGFLFPLAARPRQTILVEADIRMRQRLSATGWNFAGVTICQDDANYWMLALVEGPDGQHTVDFLENYGHVWQAQGEPKTALKREGNVSFAWKTGTVYRLRLALENGRVSAQVCDPVDGRELSSASYALGAVPAVRWGRPGLIVRDSAAECGGIAFGVRPPAPGGRGLPVVAILDDALPGHDRTANARLVSAFEARGFGVARLTAEQMLAPQGLTADAFQIAVVPQCDAVPVQLGPALNRFALEGGHLIFLGGPFLDRALWKIQGAWLDREGLQALLQTVVPRNRPFEIGPALDLKGWRRSCANNRLASSFDVVTEGPGNGPCLRLHIHDLQGWDVRQSPELTALFGTGDTFFTFLGRGCEKTGQLAVEIIERDGSRWIATAALSPEWRRVGLRLEDFLFWRDSSGTKGRGHPGDRLNPQQAVRVCFGLSASHTSAVGAGAHTVWLADIGTATDPLAGAGVAPEEGGGSIECVYPRYKVYAMENGTGESALGDQAVSRPRSAQDGRAICAISRTLGEGFGRDAKWRFVALAEKTNATARASGACEWLLLNTRFPLDGVAVAGFGHASPSVWSSPETAGRIADLARRLTQGMLLEEAGTEHFAYWPGEPVRLGARIRSFAADRSDATVTLTVRKGEQEVCRRPIACSITRGVTTVDFAWQPPAVPGAYVVTTRVEGGGGSDVIEHGFSVLDPAPAPKEAFIAARDGDFWLEGKKWYPVGINYWPLYVSGMDQADYWPGWLKDAYYSPRLVERDLRHLREMGINMVSIQTPPLEHHRNLLDFLRLCKQYGIHANLYVGQASPLAFNEDGLKAYLETARLPGNATVFAYDTVWEPGNYVFKDDAARGRWDAEWRAWVDERYGSAANAEKDWGFRARRDREGRLISPPDRYFREDGEWRVMMAAYRRFMDNLTSRLWGQANRRLRELDSNHLVSFRQGNTLPHDFALSGPVKHIDFICPEGYAIRDTDEGEDAIGFITRYVDFTTRGKPIVWSEFGQSVWDNGRMAPDAGAVKRQGLYSERFYRTALAAGANGTVPWWWVGGYRVDERSDFGILEPDRTERPSAQLIRTYGPRLRASREKPRPSAWFEFDRDAHAGGYWQAAFNAGAAAYRAAAKDGKTLGVRTAGTGTDSANTPRVAVGNVPCNGCNPPKYLDAEFNYLQVCGADGVWREAVDGAEIDVVAGQPVKARASLGNTQEATWQAGGAGGVSLVARAQGKEMGRWPVARNVPYLQDAVFGAFDLMSAAEESRSVSVRLESAGRMPFGEARVFTLRARGR